MNYFILIMLLSNTLIFIQMNHPMSMGLMILIQTLLMFIFTGWMTKNFWFSYILFLIFIGGMLVLFIYMASISSNEKFNFLMFNYMKMIFFLMIILMFNFFFLNKFFMSMSMNYEFILFSNNFYILKENFLINSKMYNSPNNLITMFLINYLLLNLIIVVKITNLFEGPLRIKY